jgi:hypothetical protein
MVKSPIYMSPSQSICQSIKAHSEGPSFSDNKKLILFSCSDKVKMERLKLLTSSVSGDANSILVFFCKAALITEPRQAVKAAVGRGMKIMRKNPEDPLDHQMGQ